MELVATGDALLTRRISPDAGEGVMRLREVLRGADVAFTNLEVALPRTPATPAALARGSHLAAPAEVVDELRWLGVGVCNVANNHALDYSLAGITDSIDRLAGAGMPYAGAGHTLREARAPRFVETPGGRLALIGVCSSNAESSLAADPGGFTLGRAGINPLRFHTTYHVTAAQLRALQDIDAQLGTAAARRARVSTSRSRSGGAGGADELHFAERRFVVDEQPQVVTAPHSGDLAATRRAVEYARTQADLVAVSMHCHEGAADGWNSPDAPRFLVEACRRWIDSGADVVIGHGPHQLRGVEVYEGRPILYSLGNFFFTNTTVPFVAREAFEKQGLDPDTATVSDYHDAAPGGGFAAHEQYWQAVVARLRLDGDGRRLELVPITLDRDAPRHRRGVPAPATGEAGRTVLARLQELSRPYGTQLRVSGGEHPVATVPLG